jgi:hypothetical protein
LPSPDPIDDPRGYQDHLVGLLGSDDPAQVQSSTPGAFRALAAEAGEDLYRRPEAGEWSVFGCLAHVADAELVMSTRYRSHLAQARETLAAVRG